MANPARGEVDLEIPNPDDPTQVRIYTLFQSTNAVCELEKRTGKTYFETVHASDRLDTVALREILWALLKRHHAKQFPSIESVGLLIDDGSRWRVMKAISEVFKLSMPPPEEIAAAASANGNGDRPPTAAMPGTGVDSTLKLDSTD
jgi:hypothetical protein